MYYSLIVLSVLLFGGGFILNDVYRQMRGGGGLKISLQASLIGSFVGILAIGLINGFKLECTPFTLVMAILNALNGILLSFCSFKALGMINLSLYSVFMMLGGMVLPFVQGIVFYGDELTVAKGICFALITAAIFVPFKRGEKKRGTVYYIGVFVLNGMSGVLSKLFTSAPYEKASAEAYSILTAMASFVISGVALLLLRHVRASKLTLPSVGVCVTHGVLNKLGNYLLVVALMHVEASVQYPMVTGGVIIVSTLAAFFGRNKPTKRELLSVAVAFVGTLALFAIPI